MTTKLEIVNSALAEVAKPTLLERAAGLAEDANECCNRSDGWEEEMEKLAYTQLSEVVEECARIAESWRSPYGGPRDVEVAQAIAAAIRAVGQSTTTEKSK